MSSDCSQNNACVNQKCIDPCPGTCGLNARCTVINHNPICSCSPEYTGDPFLRCIKVERKLLSIYYSITILLSLFMLHAFIFFYYLQNFKYIVANVVEIPSGNPCVPSPCGPNSQCRAIGDTPACTCSPNYIGKPPNCRPECLRNADCSATLACITEKCRNPCKGACGIHTICTVINHNPVCQCEPGFTGDPFSSCKEMPRSKNFSQCFGRIVDIQLFINFFSI